nr:helix-turn-helix domain-containing protein [Salinisphaera sp.]
MSARTLQRRLRESGSRYRDELADVRYQLATTYLRDPRLTVADVAQLLGYSEHSAFSRSFTRWSGQSPQRWRAGDAGDTRRPHPSRRPS